MNGEFLAARQVFVTFMWSATLFKRHCQLLGEAIDTARLSNDRITLHHCTRLAVFRHRILPWILIRTASCIAFLPLTRLKSQFSKKFNQTCIRSKFCLMSASFWIQWLYGSDRYLDSVSLIIDWRNNLLVHRSSKSFRQLVYMIIGWMFSVQYPWRSSSGPNTLCNLLCGEKQVQPTLSCSQICDHEFELRRLQQASRYRAKYRTGIHCTRRGKFEQDVNRSK